MSDNIIDLSKKRGEKEAVEDEAVLVCCSECGGVLFAPMLFQGSLIFQCAHEPCGEVYQFVELRDAVLEEGDE